MLFINLKNIRKNSMPQIEGSNKHPIKKRSRILLVVYSDFKVIRRAIKIVIPGTNQSYKFYSYILIKFDSFSDFFKTNLTLFEKLFYTDRW